MKRMKMEINWGGGIIKGKGSNREDRQKLKEKKKRGLADWV